jgi:hypothetical protein
LSHVADIASARRDALPFMHKGPLGHLTEEGCLVVGVGRGLLFYGPYWRLAEGVWRLRVAVTAGKRRRDDWACLAVEVVADNRRLLVARDFSPSECDAGELSVTFAVTAEQSETGHRAKFEFRLLALGGAELTIAAVSLEPAPVAAPTTSRWSILPRLRPTALARLTRDGALRPRFAWARGPFAARLGPRPRLASGAYALSLRGSGAGPALRVTVSLGRTRLLRADVSGEALNEGRALTFRAPEALGLDSGEEHKLSVRLEQRGGAFALTSVELAPATEAGVAAPAVARGSARVVIVGNCQAEALAQALRRGLGFDRLRVKYHFMWLSPLYLDEARRDLESCDLVLMQHIDECENYPLRAEIPARTEIVAFPCLRLAALWPFDSYNGPQDHVAIAAEGEDRAFPYLDWRLAKLRESEPDPEARFAAYATLAGADLKLVNRMAGFETRRLAALDREFDADIGAYIEAHGRRRRLFHTTTHPGPILMRKLRDWTLRRLGRARPLALDRQLDLLNEWQIPVHPEVARALGANWADAETRYHGPGGFTTWERYVRAYIRRYG